MKLDCVDGSGKSKIFLS